MCVLYIRISGLIWPAILGGCGHADRRLFFATVLEIWWIHWLFQQPCLRLTLSTLLIAALLMVSLGVLVEGRRSGARSSGLVCVSSSVAASAARLKVGYILGGTPQKIQMAELIAVVVASLVMYWP